MHTKIGPNGFPKIPGAEQSPPTDPSSGSKKAGAAAQAPELGDAAKGFVKDVKGRDPSGAEKADSALKSVALSLSGLAGMLEGTPNDAKLGARLKQLLPQLEGAATKLDGLDAASAAKVKEQLGAFLGALDGVSTDAISAASAKGLEKLASFAGAALGQDIGAVGAKPTHGIAALRPDRVIDFAQLEQVGGQGGSNPGGRFKHKETGELFYVKLAKKGDDMARNEVVMAKLYELAGIAVPELNFIQVTGKLGYKQCQDELGIASAIVPGKLEFNEGRLTGGEKIPGLYDGFMVDAWLANWDVAGLTYDNIAIVKDDGQPERAVRLDVGGAGRYRAQGAPKPGFEAKVGEIETMRDPAKAREAGHIYKHMGAAELDRAAAFVVRLSNDDIRAVVKKYGPTDATTNEALVTTLIARKDDIAKRFPKAAEIAQTLP